MRRLLLAVVVSLVLYQSTRADILYTVLGSVYTQNFDTLATSGTHSWLNNSTIPGWYSNRTTYIANNGASNTGALYSYGTGTSTERALGSVASGATATIFYGAGFKNMTGTILTKFTITFDGEQWRNGGNTATHSLVFGYKIGTGLLIDDLGYTAVSQLDFTGPIAGPTAGALDGNAAANRIAGITWTVTGVNWLPGEQLYIRWEDPNDPGNDHGLAVDNFAFSAIPEPASAAVLWAVGAALLTRRRRGW